MKANELIEYFARGFLSTIELGAVVIMVWMANWAADLNRPEGMLLAFLFGVGFLFSFSQTVVELIEDVKLSRTSAASDESIEAS